LKRSSLLFVILFMLIGCAKSRAHKKTSDMRTESPCLDGTIFNIYEADCISLYWRIMPNNELVKIRCTYSDDDSFWTTSTFYARPVDSSAEYPVWNHLCSDRYVDVYYIKRWENLVE
tara:strand:+ start:5342 stop:5692 length:351 start_codon:yes stop_codon:yes gene_type:complete